MKTVFLFIGLLSCTFSSGQSISDRLDAAMKKLQEDVQFKHAIISMYVVDSKTGDVVFDKNSQIGLAPASCQKLITSVSAFELLGKDYTYKTDISYDGTLRDSTLNGNLFFIASGDPTLGSWRWEETNEESIKQKILAGLKQKKISSISGDIILDDSKWESKSTPDGWVWEDVGNYYGAGARGINWHENQYDLMLKPGKKQGDSVIVTGMKPQLLVTVFINELKTGAEGSGDRSVIYLPEDGMIGYVRGTVPAGKETFTVSGAIPNAAILFSKEISELFSANRIRARPIPRTSISYFLGKEKIPVPSATLFTITSLPLDSINYWFLKKSVNLYGEALVKTISYEKTKFGATDTGINIIRDFWKNKGIESSSLKIIDGSGLSPANRVTTNALVSVMQYAKQQSWFPSFYHALPEMNGISMKDGYIGGVRAYTGFIKSKNGAEYTFSFIVNNFDGSAGTVREKMWKVLDMMK